MAEDFAAKRWAAKTNPKDHKPADALKALLRDIEEGKFDPEHIVIVFSTPGDNGTVGYYQAGVLHEKYAAMGLLFHAQKLMSEA